MSRSITETLKKINIELAGGAFYSIVLSLIILDLFIGFKIYSLSNAKSQDHLVYTNQSVYKLGEKNTSHNIYASSKGSKYYLSNCKSSIKEENKIYFDSEKEAQNSGYTLSKSCN